jgi:hypothetical protein
MGSAALPWCPPGPAPDRVSPSAQRRFVARFFAVRFIGFFLAFAFALDFTAALAMSKPSLFLSLYVVRIISNSITLNKIREFVDSLERFISAIPLL